MDAQRKELLQYDDSDSSLSQILARDTADFEALMREVEAVHTQLQNLPERRRIYDSKWGFCFKLISSRLSSDSIEKSFRSFFFFSFPIISRTLFKQVQDISL